MKNTPENRELIKKKILSEIVDNIDFAKCTNEPPYRIDISINELENLLKNKIKGLIYKPPTKI